MISTLRCRGLHHLRRTIGVRWSSTQTGQQLDLVTSREEPGVVKLTLNRHNAKNAFNKSLLGAFENAVNKISEDDTVRAVILASSVPGVFCAGADLKERAKLTQDQVVEFVENLRRLFTTLEDIPVPVIAAIDGAALGGGLELALAADLRVATFTSKLGLPETRLAIIPGAGGTQRLPRLVNLAVAKEMIYTGRILSGGEAKDIGLVNHVVETNPVEKARELALIISNNGPLAVRAAKRAVRLGSQLPLADGLEEERIAYASIVPTKDRIEGLQAFKERRDPQYTGS